MDFKKELRKISEDKIFLDNKIEEISVSEKNSEYLLRYLSPNPLSFFVLGRHKVVSNAIRKYSLNKEETLILDTEAAKKWLSITKVK